MPRQSRDEQFGSSSSHEEQIHAADGPGGLSGTGAGNTRDFAPVTRDGEDNNLGDYADSPVRASGDDDVSAGEIAANAANAATGATVSGLRSAGYGLLALGRNGAKGVENLARRFFARMAAMMANMGAALSGFVGGAISPRMATMIATGGSGGALIMGAVLLVNFVLFPPKYVDEPLPLRCEDSMMMAPAGASASDYAGGDTEENAKYIYGVFSALGMSDENIAGILGNWSAESGIDPTGVETIYDEPFQVGPRKKKAESVNWDIMKIDPAYANQPNHNMKTAGIGLGQWTDGRNKLLMDYSKKTGREWHDIELQLAFMIGHDDPYRVGQVDSMIKNKNPGANSVAGATQWFFNKWEGINDTSGGLRHAEASKWFTKMKGWSPNKSDAQSVLNLAESSRKIANSQAVSMNMAMCPTTGSAGGNSDAAEAATSYAWSLREYDAGNDGTDMYVWLREQMFPGDKYWASCDRSVMTAVKWSGTDVGVPPGPVVEIKRYFNAEGKKYWTKVGDNVPEKELKPGDILIHVGGGQHVWMYVGKDIIKKVWEPTGEKYDKNSVIVSGSLNDRSPSLGGEGNLADGYSTYEVYRNSKKNSSKEFTDVEVPANMKPNRCGVNKGSVPNPRGGPPCQYKTP